MVLRPCMCSKNQYYSKLHFRFKLKLNIFSKNEISSFESIFWSPFHQFSKRVLRNSTQNTEKWDILVNVYVSRFAFFFFILTCFYKIYIFHQCYILKQFQFEELGSIAPKLHPYTIFFLLKFIFHNKLQAVVGYRFLFCLVNHV